MSRSGWLTLALAGRPPPPELSQRVTDAAGCHPRLVPPDKACLYVWGHPTRADYVRLVAARIRDKGSERPPAGSPPRA